jgi:hypothetical protein
MGAADAPPAAERRLVWSRAGRRRAWERWAVVAVVGLTSGLGQLSLLLLLLFFFRFIYFFHFLCYGVASSMRIWKVSSCLVLLLLMREAQLVILKNKGNLELQLVWRAAHEPTACCGKERERQ